ncbi:hypothetical protein [Puniceicoccus vermicola]|uniref:Cell surface protein n=1 Tax=Puniceicoccus vermicola TaxID=388746 RepID=A0A7X1E4C1_9BACT|nr:hypothetical protein [Puniceicoccus vermicola]MBC2601833.1 hypothetical protein [Puniceicoccus vermicola]
MKRNPCHFALMAAGLVLFGKLSLFAQPYSGLWEDDENLYDAPIPGWVGPLGDGVAPKAPSEDDTADDDEITEGEGDDLSTFENSINPLFLAWADYVEEYVFNEFTVDPYWSYASQALGPASGDAYGVVSLGDLEQIDLDNELEPGSLTLRFAEPIRNLAGADFAVFENGFLDAATASDDFPKISAELAYVEVSTNGVEFVRFPAISGTEDSVGGYGSVDPTKLYNLVGKHANAYQRSWGTPFDLSDLEGTDPVVNGLVDLDDIRYIRIVDIPGSGDFLDSLGNPIYDAWPTYGSGGADIDALGLISQELSFEDWTGDENLSPELDKDGDGISNFGEYAFRLNPNQPDSEPPFRMEVDEDGGLYFRFRRDQRNSDVRYVVEMTEDLRDSEAWFGIAEFGPLDAENILAVDEVLGVEEIWMADQASVGVLQEVRVQVPELLAVPRFYRVRLEEAE